MNRLFTWIDLNDTQFFLFVNQKLRCQMLDILLPRFTHIAGASFTITSLLILQFFVSFPVKLWVFQALGSLGFSHVFVHIIKKCYCRERPYKKLTNVYLSSSPLKDYSFPSGHTTAAFSIAIVFSLHSLLLATILMPIASTIAFSRMYLGLHYPTDCIIGALLGSVSSITVVTITGMFI
ncbi:MAG: phosphatase PAP2 family protein [Bacillaceae bacterium]|nr:phosphatase PAP2 family protein [Bacillaceae bacterium]